MAAYAWHGPAPAIAGVGLRLPHHGELAQSRPRVGFLEVHAENFMGDGAPFDYLASLRRDYAVTLHGVGLSLGSADGVDEAHLARLADLAAAIEPALVSEHLSWSTVGGAYLNDLLPVPYTNEALGVMARNIDRVQERLGRAILIENPSSYLQFKQADMTEATFLVALARRTGAGILCDVNNIHVSAHNHGWDAYACLDAIPADLVGEIHLAGHSVNDADGVPILIDDHGGRVSEPVWRLYARAVERFGATPTLVEWDSALPPLATLLGEAAAADAIAAKTLTVHAGAA